MLDEGQLRFWDTFGFVVLRKLFSPEEMAVFAREADEVFDEDRGGRPFEGVET